MWGCRVVTSVTATPDRYSYCFAGTANKGKATKFGEEGKKSGKPKGAKKIEGYLKMLHAFSPII